jgi:hypothetical protein
VSTTPESRLTHGERLQPAAVALRGVPGVDVGLAAAGQAPGSSRRATGGRAWWPCHPRRFTPISPRCVTCITCRGARVTNDLGKHLAPLGAVPQAATALPIGRT